MDDSILLIGYGNAYCRDDGAALYIINALRDRQGLRQLEPDEDGLDDLGHGMDSVMLHQLVPEIVPVAAQYGLLLFVDAHVGSIPDDVRVIRVEEEHRFHAVTHHMSPGMILAMARTSTGVGPSAFLVSVRGENFDFGIGLSETSRACADQAVQKILELVEAQRPGTLG